MSNGGQSALEGRTVRARSRELAESLVGSRTVRPRWADGPPLFFKLVPEMVSVSVGFKVERLTVRPWGADGPPANLRFVPEMLFLWFGLKS